jgi:L-2-hydroxyglutarate oxidase
MNPKRYDVVIIGGGILGVTLSYWLSTLFDANIAIIERDNDIALHETMRNTGVIHRPFYLNPVKKKIWAFSAQNSYKMWKSLAYHDNLPWKEIGTLEVAKTNEQMKSIENYGKWAVENGMMDKEFEILNSKEIHTLEHEVTGVGAIHSKTDACVDYRAFALSVFNRSKQKGVKLIKNTKVVAISNKNEGILKVQGKINGYIQGSVILNCSAGGALKIARSEGLGMNYSNMFFRGDYWIVAESYANKIQRNIYTVPEHHEFPFLDPHFIIKHNGRREIGPTATIVSSAYSYKEKYSMPIMIWKNILSPPIKPKLKLLFNREFQELASEEWKSSISRKAMAKRLKKFIPNIGNEVVIKKGISGIRVQVVDNNGFVPEAIILKGEKSVHIINFNSPGATGSPTFSALLITRMIDEGYFDNVHAKKEESNALWKMSEVVNHVPQKVLNEML